MRKKSMKYKDIDEKKGISCCRLNDLITKQVAVSPERESTVISSLILFYDPEGQKIVLNRDNPNYNLYLTLAEKYLVASPEKRRELAEKIKSEDLKEAIRILDVAIEERESAKILSIIDKMPAFAKEYGLNVRVLATLWRKNPDPLICLHQAFAYGFIQGKRMERARRKV